MKHQINRVRLEKNLVIAARLVKTHGIKFLPTFERLEAELNKTKTLEASLERALQYCND